MLSRRCIKIPLTRTSADGGSALAVRLVIPLRACRVIMALGAFFDALVAGKHGSSAGF